MYKEILKKPFVVVVLFVAFVLSGCTGSENKNAENKDLNQEFPREIVEAGAGEIAEVEKNNEGTAETSTIIVADSATEDIANDDKNSKENKKKKESKKDDKKDKENERKEESEEEEKKDSEDDKIKPEPCFDILGNRYNENTFYSGAIKLNASCSKNAKEYQWYINGNSAGIGETYNFSYVNSGISKVKIDAKTPIEIKLVVTSEDGLVDSEVKTMIFREIPKPTVCFNQESSKVKSFKLSEEYTFDASCSTFSDENPIIEYIWKFRDGGIDNAIEKKGVDVRHSFLAPSTTWEGGYCDGADDRLEVQLDIKTKIGGNLSSIHHYCIEE